jgi:ABC-2 type transport system permease protein
MRAWLIQAYSVFIKEIHEVRRQPRLIMGLIAGPFLVLALFGASFRSGRPVLRTVLVWPEHGVPGIQRETIESMIGRNFKLVAVVEDGNEGLQMLHDGLADVLQIVPGDIYSQVQSGRQAQLVIYSYAIDPNAEAWIRTLALSEVNYINRNVLLNQTDLAQQRAVLVRVELSDAQGVLSRFDVNLAPELQRRAIQSVGTLRSIFNLAETYLPKDEEDLTWGGYQLLGVKREITRLQRDLDLLEMAIHSGSAEEYTERLERITEQLNDIVATIDIFVGLPPEAIVSPVWPAYRNLRGEPYSMVIYYTPGVLALLIQHLAMTLGSLALIRERLMGAFEMFQVAPIKTSHLLVGKTLAYCLYVLLAGLALTLLLRGLDVPAPFSLGLFILLLALLSLASIGIGMVISVISTSDSQAIQFTMIALLFSIFFSGLFLPLPGFTRLAAPVSAALPMTHGLEGLQALILIGRAPDLWVWISLALITLVSYGLVLVIMRRISRQVLS